MSQNSDKTMNVGGKPLHVTDTDFQRQVSGSELPVVVDFHAPWCGPCRHLGPVLDKLAGEYAGRLTIAKVNVDESPAKSLEFGIRSIPALVFIHRGEVVDSQVGSAPYAVLKRTFDTFLTEAEKREARLKEQAVGPTIVVEAGQGSDGCSCSGQGCSGTDCSGKNCSGQDCCGK